MWETMTRIEEIEERYNDAMDILMPPIARDTRLLKLAKEDVPFLLAEVAALKAELSASNKDYEIRSKACSEAYDKVESLLCKNAQQAKEIIELEEPCYCCRDGSCQTGCRCNQDTLNQTKTEVKV